MTNPRLGDLLEEAVVVFEGGGVLGSAYLGAIAEMREQGIRFAAAAGTSAGSIAAALVAADLNANSLSRAFDDLDLHSVLAEAQPIEWQPSAPKRAALTALGALGGSAERLSNVLLRLGSYSTSKLCERLNSILADALGISGEVHFEHLPKQLAVFATDLTTCQPATWSTNDPACTKVSVAKAVEASCAIPFFFQPVWHAGRAFVDGGVLANLPIHLASTFNECDHLPVFAFKLQAAAPAEINQASFGPSQLIERLASSVVSGNVSLQIARHNKCVTVPVYTNKIQSTDFTISKDQVASLRTCGKNAVQSLLSDPSSSARLRTALEHTWQQTTRGAAFDHLDEEIRQVQNELCIIATSPHTFTDLMPSLLRLRLTRPELPVRVLVEQSDARLQNGLEPYRLPAACGCSVRELHGQPMMQGLIRDPNTPSAAAVILRQSKDGKSHARRLIRDTDAEDIVLYQDYFDEQWELASSKTDSKIAKPVIAPIQNYTLLDTLKRSPSYSDPKITLNIERIDPTLTKPVLTKVEGWRLRRVRWIDELAPLMQTEFCAPGHLSGTARVTCPPIVEQVSDCAYQVIRGHHRILYSLRTKIAELPMVVVRGRRGIFAVDDRGWDKVRVVPDINLQRSNEHYARLTDHRLGPLLGTLGVHLLKRARTDSESANNGSGE